MKELILVSKDGTIEDLYFDTEGNKVEASSLLYLCDDDYDTLKSRAGITKEDIEDNAPNVYFEVRSAIEDGKITDTEYRLAFCTDEFVKRVDMTENEQSKLLEYMEAFCRRDTGKELTAYMDELYREENEMNMKYPDDKLKGKKEVERD